MCLYNRQKFISIMAKKLIDILQEKFGRIYILSMTERQDRRDLVERQLSELGVPLPDTTPFIRYFYGTSFPFNSLIANAFNTSGKGRFTKANEYDCARNHYGLVKTCRDLLPEDSHSLILEDDILFRKDWYEIASYIEALPEDYDIAQFGGFTTDPRIHSYIDNTQDKWVKHRSVGLWNCSGYAMSRRGMEFYLTFMDKIKFWVADGPLYKAPLSDKVINTYVSREPIVIQASKKLVSSDIRTEENDTIDYDNQNEYEKNISLDEFFSV